MQEWLDLPVRVEVHFLCIRIRRMTFLREKFFRFKRKNHEKYGSFSV